MPSVAEDERLLVKPLEFPGFFRVIARYGYRDLVDQGALPSRSPDSPCMDVFAKKSPFKEGSLFIEMVQKASSERSRLSVLLRPRPYSL